MSVTQVDPVLLEAFSREASAAGANVHGPVSATGALEVVRTLVIETGQQRVLAWDADAVGIDPSWTQLRSWQIDPICPNLPVEAEAREAALATIDDVAIGLTGAIGGLADTGTIAVASGAGRPRLAWLLPPRHVAILDVALIVPDMATFFERHRPPFEAAAHVAFVTGPSRTADIELTLTRGVHGPRELHLVLVGNA